MYMNYSRRKNFTKNFPPRRKGLIRQSTINNNLTNNIIYSTSSLTAKEIYEHLLNFKVSNNTHTDIIRNPKGTQSNCFIYYVTDKKKQAINGGTNKLETILEYYNKIIEINQISVF